MTNSAIKIFEHTRLQIGKSYDGLLFTTQHYQLLAAYQSHLGHQKFYRLEHKRVRFLNYVGVLRVGNLTIEVLPKIDQYARLSKDQIQGVLLDLLRYCEILHLETVPNSFVQLQKHSILDVYVAFFVNEAEKALHYGLFRAYSRYPKNAAVLKGPLIFSKQIQHNSFDRTKFYCNQTVFDFDHPFNRILKAALEKSQLIASNLFLRKRIQYLLRQIPFEVGAFKGKGDFDLAKKDRNTQKNVKLLSYAQLILEQLSGDFKKGRHPVIGLFFDMNLLYEKFIFTLLKRLETKQLVIKKQSAQLFWGKRKIRPDIVFDYKGKRYIMDTKWKLLSSPHPSMDDLRQIFVYCQYFNACKGVLVYPHIKAQQSTVSDNYHPYPNQTQAVNCQLLETGLIKNGRLNKELGKEMLHAIIESQ